MQHELLFQDSVLDQIDALTEQMHKWEVQPDLDEKTQEEIRKRITPFSHTTRRYDLKVVGADGSGEYPLLNYADSFVYLVTAKGVGYISDEITGLKELAGHAPLVDFPWLPSDREKARSELMNCFQRLTGHEVLQIIEESDYRHMKEEIGVRTSPKALFKDLVVPPAHQGDNHRIQMMSVGELSACLRWIESDDPNPDYVLYDGTLSLPFLNGPTSLFFEHLKRYCCVRARDRDVVFLCFSKSHGLRSIETLEQLAQETFGLQKYEIAEHWYLRLPVSDQDPWEFPLIDGRNLPPTGAVTYLVRFHRGTSIFRIDIDKKYWDAKIWSADPESMQRREQKIFADLDYTCHDQRSYGYPYPMKSAHDRASLTKQEREAFRSKVISAATKRGMQRSLFRDASVMSGHA